MPVRAKFVCRWIETSNTEPELKTIHLNAVYSPVAGSENAMYWKYTPCGTISLSTVNEEAWKQFEEGKEYYVDFNKSE